MTQNKIIDKTIKEKYKFGFVTNIDQDTIPPGLNEEVIHIISSKKNEPKWLLDWRLKAYRKWIKMNEPNWAKVNYPEIDYDSISYYSSPKKKKKLKSLDEVDPEILRTYEKLGIPIEEQKMLSGVVGFPIKMIKGRFSALGSVGKLFLKFGAFFPIKFGTIHSPPIEIYN